MTVFPFQINEVMHLYGKAARQRSPVVPDKEQVDPRDVVSISAEARERQVLDQARAEAMQHIRTTR